MVLKFMAVFAAFIASAITLAQPAPKRPPRVVVSIPPLAGLVRPLLPEGSKVEILIPPGVSEHGYDIPPSKLAAMAGADLVVYVGLGLEPQIEKYVKDHPRAGRRDVSFAEAVGRDAANRTGHDHEDHDHAEGETCEHHHGADPHLWLDPILVRAFVPVLAEHVISLRAEGDESSVKVAARRDAMLERVRELDAAFVAMSAAAPRKTLVVGHDAYRLLADRYGLRTLALAGLSASEPTPSALAAVSSAAKNEGVTTVFIEPQLSRSAADRIARACKLKVRVLDPLGSGDYFGLMHKNLAEIGEALGVPYTEARSAPK